jgi:hypothetical protein
MNDDTFAAKLAADSKFNKFKIRRTLERLREGLFDPFGVQLLTTGEEELARIFAQVFHQNVTHKLDGTQKKSNTRKACHLCVCGSYGQGKSHTLNYIEQQALDQNFVVSYINLDPVQVCFHNFNIVYRSLMENLSFPDTKDTFVKVWKNRADKWLGLPENKNKTLKDLIPEIMPHKFQCVLTAMAQKNMAVTQKKRKLKKHARFQPNSFPWILKNALLGKNIPAWRLSSVFKYRQVDYYKDKSMVCKKPGEYLDMVQGMARLFQNIGYSGWVVLFDEGESIIQNNIISRAKSYKLLDKILYPKIKTDALFPVFAFTNDFFSKVEYEEYHRLRPPKRCKDKKQDKKKVERKDFYFDKNYHNEWKNIQKLTLHDLASQEWETLIQRLVIIHGLAYGWRPSMDLMINKIKKECLKYKSDETRLTLKLIVNTLDMEQQSRLS